MTTSGVYTYSLTFNEAAAEAFDILQIGSDGETLSGDMIARFGKSANLVLKDWETSAPHLWAQTEGTLFPTVGQVKYDLRDATTHVANTWYETTTTADTTAGATSITVTSISDIQVNDVIGIIQNDNDVFWTTVAYAPTGSTVKLSDAITLATTSGAYVRNYRVGTSTSPDLKPVNRISRFRRKDSSGYEIPIKLASRTEYFDQPNKTASGTAIMAYYDRQDIAGEEGGVIYLWNAPDSSVPVINFTYERKIQIYVNGTETIDLPDYAHQAFIYECAIKLIPKYGATTELASWIAQEHMRLKADMLNYDVEPAPIRVRMRRA